MPASESLRGQGRDPARLAPSAAPYSKAPGHIHSLCRIHFLQALLWHKRKEMEPMTVISATSTQKSTGPGTQSSPAQSAPRVSMKV